MPLLDDLKKQTSAFSFWRLVGLGGYSLEFIEDKPKESEIDSNVLYLYVDSENKLQGIAKNKAGEIEEIKELSKYLGSLVQ